MFAVGFVQFCPVRYDVWANVATVERLLAGVRADLLVLPELANSGYMYATAADLDPYAEPSDGSGHFLSALRQLAERTGGVIVTGFAERGRAGLYNSAAAVDADRVLQVYRKTHLFQDEQDPFLPGDTGFRIFEHRGVRIGMMVCFDWFFPEAARTLALRGAQIIAHPANLVLPWCQTGMVTRSSGECGFRDHDQSLRDGRAERQEPDLHRRVADPRHQRPAACSGGCGGRCRDAVRDRSDRGR